MLMVMFLSDMGSDGSQDWFYAFTLANKMCQICAFFTNAKAYIPTWEKNYVLVWHSKG